MKIHLQLLVLFVYSTFNQAVSQYSYYGYNPGNTNSRSGSSYYGNYGRRSNPQTSDPQYAYNKRADPQTSYSQYGYNGGRTNPQTSYPQYGYNSRNMNYGTRSSGTTSYPTTGDITEDNSESTDEYIINLSHLQNRIYGFPNKKSGMKVANWRKDSGVNPEELGTYAEGDILVSTASERSAYSNEFFRWPNGIIPYQIAWFNQNDYAMIMSAINDFHTYTCVRFVPQTNERAYIRITSELTGCHSAVGYNGAIYDVNLQSPGCTSTKGTIIHELMHAVGFVHEQSRHDRDEHVYVQWNNIGKSMAYNFYTYKKGDTDSFGFPYDYDSVMHYSRNAFSINGGETIVPKPYSNRQLGQRIGFSQYDVKKLNAMYKCNAAATPQRRSETGLTNNQQNVVSPYNRAVSPRYMCTTDGRYCWYY